MFLLCVEANNVSLFHSFFLLVLSLLSRLFKNLICIICVHKPRDKSSIQVDITGPEPLVSQGPGVTKCVYALIISKVVYRVSSQVVRIHQMSSSKYIREKKRMFHQTKGKIPPSTPV